MRKALFALIPVFGIIYVFFLSSCKKEDASAPNNPSGNNNTNSLPFALVGVITNKIFLLLNSLVKRPTRAEINPKKQEKPGNRASSPGGASPSRGA